MNYENQLCQAIDLLANERENEAQTLIESTIAEIKRFLPEALEKAPLYYYWGQGLELLEEPEQALLQYEAALKAHVEYIPAWEALCRALLEELDRPDEAKTILLSRLLPHEPDNEIYQDWLVRADIALNDNKFLRDEAPSEDGEEN